MHAHPLPRDQQGFALLEVLIAILIFSVAILGTVGLQAATVRHQTDAKYRVDASFLAEQAIGTMWADRTNLAGHAVKDEDVAALPNGKRTIAVNGSQVTVTITWKLPGESVGHTYSTTTQISG